MQLNSAAFDTVYNRDFFNNIHLVYISIAQELYPIQLALQSMRDLHCLLF